MKRRIFNFLCAFASVLFNVEPAHAFPVLGFLGGILAAGGIVTPLIGFGTIGAVNAGFAFATFLSSGFGSLLLSVGISAAQYFLGRQKGPTIESARITVRISEPERWINAGRVRIGGAALFGEYAENGDFWCIVVHSDSMMVNKVQTIFDEIPVVFNNETDEDAGFTVTTKEFTIEQKEGGTPNFQVWTRTYDDNDPVPPPLTKFKTAFPAWTDEHKLAGTTYSIMRCPNLSQENRYKVMTWSGPFHLGEPSVSIVADFSKMYDPRNPDHNISDAGTWSTSRNPIIIWAWFRTHPYGRNKPMSSINWAKIKEGANICDIEIVDRYGDSAPQYVCGISIPDSKERHVAESEILLSADAIVMYDETGLCYAMPGAWEEPDVTLTAMRDIMAMQSREAQDGETETDGVIVKYIDPAFNWIAQPCAPWKNPLYNKPGTVPKYLTVEILACQNHRQAVQLAKAIGEQSQPAYRLAPTIGLRGIKLRRRRTVNLDYDAIWNGSYLIATNVEIDEAGIMTGCGLVPVTDKHWTLLAGEEGEKPVPEGEITYDSTLPLPTGVVVDDKPVPGSDGNSVRLEITFDAPVRVDYRYEFQYRKAGDLIWRPFIVLMADILAYSDTIESTATYNLQERTVTTSGRASDWHALPDFYVIAFAPTADTTHIKADNTLMTSDRTV